MISSSEILGLLEGHIRFQEGMGDNENVPAFCPFHKGGMERSPSMYIYIGPATQKKAPGTAFCHTCEKGWSLFGLLKELGVSKDQVPLLQEMIDEQPKRKHSDKLEFTYSVLPEEILGAFEFIPKQMLNWGFDVELIRKHEIGFDRERKRIIFPLRSHLGELVGLSGRTVRGDIPRYKVYRKELWSVLPGYDSQKGQLVWGLDKLYRAYMEHTVDRPIILCEGFKACLWVQQAGFEESVALLGAYLTKHQRYLLERVANEVIIFLDNDDAGLRGTEQILNLYPGFNVKVAKYPTNDPVSPDDLSVTEIHEAIRSAVPATLWRIRNVRKG